MTSKRANAVNRAIAEACGWTDIRSRPDDYGIPPGFNLAINRIPNYTTDMNAAIAAAGELLPGGFTIEVNDYGIGLVSWWAGHDKVTLTVNPSSDKIEPADIAAAICEAIVTARQLVVESEASDDKQ